jgi:acetyl-CoA carboxylase beta subunit
MATDKMFWLFAGKGEKKRVGQDYFYKCSNCGYVIFVENLEDNSSLPKSCHKCKKKDGDQ